LKSFPSALVTEIPKLKNGKSLGLDNIPTNMLKCAQNELLPRIEKLFNS
jgi:hypothetical protein